LDRDTLGQNELRLLEPTAVIDNPGLEVMQAITRSRLPSPASYEELYRLAGDNKQPYMPKELYSSSRYAQWIRASAGESVLLVPQIDERDVSGFDGIIKNSHGDTIANYSLKDTERNPLISVNRAIEKINTYSNHDEWLKLLFKPQRNPSDVRPVIGWLSTVFKIFGIGQGSIRPARIVVDIRGDGQIPNKRDSETRDIQDAIRRSNGKVESVTVLKNNSVLMITADGKPEAFEFEFSR
jgi:hypothetical protein